MQYNRHCHDIYSTGVRITGVPFPTNSAVSVTIQCIKNQIQQDTAVGFQETFTNVPASLSSSNPLCSISCLQAMTFSFLPVTSAAQMYVLTTSSCRSGLLRDSLRTGRDFRVVYHQRRSGGAHPGAALPALQLFVMVFVWPVVGLAEGYGFCLRGHGRSVHCPCVFRLICPTWTRDRLPNSVGPAPSKYLRKRGSAGSSGRMLPLQ